MKIVIFVLDIGLGFILHDAINIYTKINNMETKNKILTMICMNA